MASQKMSSGKSGYRSQPLQNKNHDTAAHAQVHGDYENGTAQSEYQKAVIRLNRAGVCLNNYSMGEKNNVMPRFQAGVNIKETTPPEFSEALIEKINTLLDGDEPQMLEFRTNLQGKEIVDLEINIIACNREQVVAIIEIPESGKNKVNGSISNHYASAIINSMEEGLMLIDRDGIVLETNDTNARNHGMHPAEFKGRCIYDFYRNTNPIQRKKILNTIFVKGEIVKREFRLDEQWMEYLMQALRSPSGTIEHAVICARNITSSKSLLQTLEESLSDNREVPRFAENLFNSIPDIIGIQDRHHWVIRYNQAGYDFLGIEPREAEGRKCYELYGNSSECEICATSITYETLKPAHVEKYFPDRDIWLDIRSYPILDDFGEIQYVIEHLRDISQLKQIEIALKRSEERFRELFNSSAAGILIGSAEGIITEANNTFIRMTGYRPDQLIGRHISEGIFTAESIKANPFRFDLLNQGHTVTNERTLIAANNRLIEVEMHTHILPDGTYQSIYHDISERKKAEREVNRQNIDLKLINDQKDKFFSIIAHDLRSPFTSFLSLTELMEEEIDTMPVEEIKSTAGELRKSADNLYRLLENLLEWSMIQRNAKPFTPEVLRLRDVAEQATEALIESAQNKKIRVFNEIPGNVKVYADRPMLEGILRNLFSNAVKFTRENGNIFLEASPCREGFLQISITDTGIGIPEPMLRSLFSISGRNNRKGTWGEPSTGLGLLLCKEFVEKNGGKLTVRSIAGKGSCFTFTLPEPENQP